MSAARIRRLLAPRHVAVIGGQTAAGAIRQCREIGFTGEIWPVNPGREQVEGLPCHPDVASLPEAPDAAFVATPRESTVDVIRQLAERGTGGAVCHAAGFAEDGSDGRALQDDLRAAADGMPVIGPNCIGVLNYLDGVALWADQHGGQRADSGVAVITQSGNIGQNLTMQRRSLPIAAVLTLGNAAVTSVPDVVDALLDDPRITAIGLHLEGVGDVVELSRVALAALRRGVPMAVLKTGGSTLGAGAALSHTSSLAGSDVLADALFRRLGVVRVHEIATFVETLKFLHVHGPLDDVRISSASCSGGEAALIADTAERHGAAMPALSDGAAQRLRESLGERVHVANPLDYHAYIWGDLAAQRECFTALLDADYDVNLLVLDLPRDDRADPEQWLTTVDAYVQAQAATGARACVVSSLPEGIPEQLGRRLLAAGIAPMQGMEDCVRAVVAAQRVGRLRRRADWVVPVDPAREVVGPEVVLDEHAAKRELAASGVDVPEGSVVRPPGAASVAGEFGFPVVAKALSASLAHKSDIGGVRVGLTDEEAVRDAVGAMSGLAEQFLVERMVPDSVAELIVGLRRDPQFGLALTVGAGGVLVEVARDAATLLLPVSRDEIEEALRSLGIWPLLAGFRGRAAGDVSAVVDAVAGIAEYARRNDVHELDVNPLLVLPEGRGAVAVDALVKRERK